MCVCSVCVCRFVAAFMYSIVFARFLRFCTALSIPISTPAGVSNSACVSRVRSEREHSQFSRPAVFKSLDARNTDIRISSLQRSAERIK